MHGMWWGSGPWFGGLGMGFLWPLVMPVFLGALVALAVGVMRRPSRTSGPPPGFGHGNPPDPLCQGRDQPGRV
jgi:hypothetical protein